MPDEARGGWCTGWRHRTASALTLASVALLTSGAAQVARPASPATPPVPTTAPDPIASLREDLLAATRRPGVERAAWGIVVQSLDTADTLFELNARTLLVPASVAKLVTVASAAEAVGWDFRFDTVLRATGPIVAGVLWGDLLVTGSGDPTIGGRAGQDLSAWTAAVKAAGIGRIEGRIVGDDNALEEPRPQLAWAWDDLGYVAGSLFGALNLTENQMPVTVAPGLAAGAPTRITVPPHATSRPIANRSVTGARGSTALLWPEQRPADAFLTIDGSLPLGSAPITLPVSVGNPTLWFANVLRHRLVEAGIQITGRAVDIDDDPPPDRAAATRIFMHRSEPLATIVQPLLKDSINLYAEAVMRLNVPRGTFPTNDAALAALRARLAAWGLPPGSQQIIDGSGLSRRDTLAPEALIAVLRRMHDPTGVSPFVRGLPVAGVDGSLERRMRGTPAERNVRAKTGTMTNVRSLAGYVTTRDRERLAFAIILNNFEGTNGEANQAVDAIAVRLASFSRQGN